MHTQIEARFTRWPGHASVSGHDIIDGRGCSWVTEIREIDGNAPTG
jgi:hypothetical protein